MANNINSIKNSLVNFIKRSKFFYNIYSYAGSIFLFFIKLFIRTDQKLILFVSYGGKGYDDSPKEITEAMLNDKRYDEYKIVWAFLNPEKIQLSNRIIKVKIDSIKYFIIAIKAKVWITNVSIERGLRFKKNNNIYLNTWHGSPLKKIGFDTKSSKSTFFSKFKSNYDYFCAQSEYDAKIFMRAFGIENRNILKSGLPRNDKINTDFLNDAKDRLRHLNIQGDKRVILYAPTFREYENFDFMVPIDWDNWMNQLGDDFVVLLRVHHTVTEKLNFKDMEGFVYNVSDYPFLNDLMLVSDILISDYSSIFFDFSILERPMICYTYDFEKYAHERGLYFDVREELSGGSLDEMELIKLLKNLNYNGEIEKAKVFKEKYVQNYGNATNEILDVLIHRLKPGGIK